ncbi:hypothetical protein [Shewanella algae]|uniref:hypothetical protein n=1 Tax=Shewanella algae TaxID=38313 RepID=UPI001AAEDA4B|nr:hypothetical protein [Shewanella algae]MBO2663744.1 hypothetical protein [Shewanella algae]MCL1055187.1 hypothetical protein [Shewanella algae]
MTHVIGFFVQLSEALARTYINHLTEFTCLADVLELEAVVRGISNLKNTIKRRH